MVVETANFGLELLLAAFAGGAIGAAIGGMGALSLSGLVIVVGEVANASAGAATGSPAATGVTALIGYGPALGPHVAFAGGIAAAAYMGRRESPESSFPFHRAKDIFTPIGVQLDALVVGGAFGTIGYLVASLLMSSGIPVEPVMGSLVVSGFLVRIAFGYPLLGRIGENVLDMSPYDSSAKRTPLEGSEDVDHTRLAVEPWTREEYEWEKQAFLGLVVGLFSAYVAYVSQRYFLAFGITATLLGVGVFGDRRVPVVHHMALPASISALAILPEFGVGIALVTGGFFGVVSGIGAELGQRICYAHAETHVDPPAIGIVLTSLLISLLTTIGIFDQLVIPAF